MKCLKYGATAVQVANLDGVLLAAVAGPVDQAIAQTIMRDAKKWAPHRSAQVVDYASATVQLTADDLYAAAVRAHGPTEPTAIVARQEHWELFRKYVELNASRGVLKAVFTTSEAAGRWAVEQAVVMEYWARLERRQRAWP